uniref:L1 transposable element RRM domain-containing protein n=1 Tax=Naja naja TaxID=35670 RepID=A0A8C6XCT7_NAJNA
LGNNYKMSRKAIAPSSQSTIPASSPSLGQQSIQAMLQQEKEKEKEDTLQKILQEIQILQTKVENVEKSNENISQKIEQTNQKVEKIQQKIDKTDEKVKNIQQKIGKTDEQVENIQEMMTKYDEKIKKIEEQDKQRDKEIGNINIRLSEVEKDRIESLRGEMDRSEFYLRFQNVEEEKGENLVGKMIEILAEALEITKEKMMDGMDEVFRVHTRYAMRNKLPREVHIRFTKKITKTQILQMTREKTLKYKDKEIVVLKQVPRRVRETRREYLFLTKELLRKGINYRWLIPEGLLFTWREQRHRIDTVEKAESFYYEYIRRKEEDTRKEEPLLEPQKELIALERNNQNPFSNDRRNKFKRCMEREKYRK